MPQLEAIDLELDEKQEEHLTTYLRRELGAASLSHEPRQKYLASLLRAYKSKPKNEVKNFPWPNASNVVVPIVAITVDTICSRLQRAVFGAKDLVEVHIKTAAPPMMTVPTPDPTTGALTGGGTTQLPLEDKTVRDWLHTFIDSSGARDRLRTIFFDMSLYGDAFVKPLWSSEESRYHMYNPAGQVVEQNVPGYEGVKWHVPSPTDVLWPVAFDQWDALPWFANILRYSEAEMSKMAEDKIFRNIDRVKAKRREDAAHREQQEAENVSDSMDVYELHEIHGIFELIPSETAGPDTPSVWEECILTYSLEYNVLVRSITNPYFGKKRHFVKIPYLVQAHEIPSMGAAEQVLQFQEEASTAHNQRVDAGTASNAGIVVTSPDLDLGPNEEIYPGKQAVADVPKDAIHVVHLNEPSAAVGQTEKDAIFMAEKRSGVTTYNMGMESPVVGSRATATGTTALINEGNMRFWVSIDDMRHAIEELLYLTIQQEQQLRPDGYEFAPGRWIQFPQGDPRVALGLKLTLSSESVNRDLEVQQMQLLIQVMNDYYMRLNQAAMLIANPQFPAQAKMVAVQTMTAASVLIRKFVERFDIENLDTVVPTIMQTLQMMAQNMQALSGQGQAPGQPPGPPTPPGGPGGRALPPAGPPAPGGGGF